MKGIIVFLAVLGLVFAADVPICDDPVEGGGVIHFPNPDDCSTFYKCGLAGEAVLLPCPPNLWWNAELEVCDYPANIPEGSCIPPKPTTPKPATTAKP